MAEEQQENVKGGGEPVVSNVIIESFEDDMKAMGVEIPDVKESKETVQTPKEDDKKAVETKTADKKQSRAQRRIQRQQDEIKALKEQIATQESKPSKVKEEAKAPEPEEFEDYEAYETALAEFESTAKKPDTKPEKKENKDDGLATRIAEMREDGIEDYSDFEELVSVTDLALTVDIINEALDSENPSEIVYYLAKNKKETLRISKLTKKQIQKEILKIELKLEEKPTVNSLKAASNAPEPINPIDGSSPEVRTAETATSYNEFERMRTAQRGKPGW